jgi:hypothetical protein
LATFVKEILLLGVLCASKDSTERGGAAIQNSRFEIQEHVARTIAGKKS